MNHVAIITDDTGRLYAFTATSSRRRYRHTTEQEGVRLSIVDVGNMTELNV